MDKHRGYTLEEWATDILEIGKLIINSIIDKWYILWIIGALLLGLLVGWAENALMTRRIEKSFKPTGTEQCSVCNISIRYGNFEWERKWDADRGIVYICGRCKHKNKIKEN